MQLLLPRGRAGVSVCARVVGVALFALLALGLAGPARAQGPDFAPGEFFVAFHAGTTPANVALPGRFGAQVEGIYPEARAVAVRVADPQAFVGLSRHPFVAYVEPVPMRYALGLADAELEPGAFNGLYGLLNTGATDVHALRGFTGAGVKVGVADTGLDYTHPDIAPNYQGGIDTYGKDNDPWWNGSKSETHGTHVAATALGALSTAGVRGVAYGAELYHARVLGPRGGTAKTVMDGVRWLVETAGCKVVNLSLGGGGYSTTEKSFYDNMRAEGALVVCAAGNDGTGTLSYPAGYAANIAVGAVDRNNTHASFSNWGTGLDVVAPGVSVLSAVPANQGIETSVTTDQSFTAFAMTYSGTTSSAGIAGDLYDCGLGKTGDFPAGVRNNIALIQRGDTSFADKVNNAMKAGARAAVIYNNVPGDFLGTLGRKAKWIPAVSVSLEAGAVLLDQTVNSSSTPVPGTVVNLKPSSWDAWDGTSMATPHVTGVIALIWSAAPSLSNDAVESHLFTTCTDLGAANYDTLYGHGIINALAAVDAASSP